MNLCVISNNYMPYVPSKLLYLQKTFDEIEKELKRIIDECLDIINFANEEDILNSQTKNYLQNTIIAAQKKIDEVAKNKKDLNVVISKTIYDNL